MFSFLRHMGIVVSALVTYAGKEYLSKFVQSESDVVVSICYVIIVIAVIALYELWSSMIKSLAKGFLPVKKYDDLISDLKQVYLFSDRDLEADGCDYDKTKGS